MLRRESSGDIEVSLLVHHDGLGDLSSGAVELECTAARRDREHHVFSAPGTRSECVSVLDRINGGGDQNKHSEHHRKVDWT